MVMLSPKVLVFTPIYKAKDYCLDEFLENCKKITYKNYEHIIIDNSDTKQYYYELQSRLEGTGIKVFHTERGNNSREALARAQNVARKYFLEGDYKFLLSLESDIFPPIDFIQKLILHLRPVVTGFYEIGSQTVRLPCITIKEYHKNLGAFGTRLLRKDEYKDYTNVGLKEVAAGGMGICLMERWVVELFPFYYDPRFTGHSDVYFFNDCLNHSIPVYVDTDIVCDHKNSDWANVTDR